jgi:hypothetical protein
MLPLPPPRRLAGLGTYIPPLQAAAVRDITCLRDRATHNVLEVGRHVFVAASSSTSHHSCLNRVDI